MRLGTMGVTFEIFTARVVGTYSECEEPSPEWGDNEVTGSRCFLCRLSDEKRTSRDPAEYSPGRSTIVGP